MIISGVYQSKKTFEKVCDLTRLKIKSQEVVFSNSYFQIIAGYSENGYASRGEILTSECGILIGKVFQKHSDKQFAQRDFEVLKGKKSQYVTDHYWGNYLFVHDNRILRDPIGQFPLFYTQFEGVTVFSSDLSVLVDLLERQPQINLAYCTSVIKHIYVTSEQTIFENIFEVPHGCELAVDADQIQVNLVWNPVDYLEKQPIGRDFDDLIEATLSQVLKSWFGDVQCVFLEFSGGLDSSSLLFMSNPILKRMGKRVFPLHYFNSNFKASDERPYADRVLQEIGATMQSFDIKDMLPFSSLDQSLGVRPAFPTPSLMFREMQEKILSYGQAHQDSLFMSGHGGDHVFFALPAAESLTDYLLNRGFSGYGAAFKDFALYYRHSLFWLLRIQLKSMFQYFLRQEYGNGSAHEQTPWFSEEFSHVSQRLSPHPFFLTKKHLLPGQYTHIKTIYQGLSTLKNYLRHDIFYPLFSQPIIELLLSIPAYEFCKNGHDRYLLRYMISQKYHTQHVWRRNKGETSGLVQMGIRKNRAQIEKLCFEGKMAKSGLIDMEQFSYNLEHIFSGDPSYLWPVTNLISLEYFLKQWEMS